MPRAIRRIFSVTRFWASTGPVKTRVVWKLSKRITRWPHRVVDVADEIVAELVSPTTSYTISSDVNRREGGSDRRRRQAAGVPRPVHLRQLW
jgi:hypothetical protein